jgi:hypothetical protein
MRGKSLALQLALQLTCGLPSFLGGEIAAKRVHQRRLVGWLKLRAGGRALGLAETKEAARAQGTKLHALDGCADERWLRPICQPAAGFLLFARIERSRLVAVRVAASRLVYCTTGLAGLLLP